MRQVSVLSQKAEDASYLPKWRGWWVKSLRLTCTERAKAVHKNGSKASWKEVDATWDLPPGEELIDSNA